MSKFTIILTIGIVYVCCVAMGLGGDANSGSGTGGSNNLQGGVVSPKNIRILSPAASRLYRLLRKGLNGDVADDDLFTEDENYFRKRQYDDYGHMRFGKRNNQPVKDFDDYGHMRFGK